MEGVCDLSLLQQTIGSLMKQPTLLNTYLPTLASKDFTYGGSTKIALIVFAVINNLIYDGVTAPISIVDLETEVEREHQLTSYNQLGGRNFVEASLDKGNPANYQQYYTAVKKLSLFNELLEKGYDLGPYNYVALQFAPGTKALDAQSRYTKATAQDLLAYVEKQLSDIRGNHALTSVSKATAADDLDTLIPQEGEKTEVGAELPGEKYNSIVQGALLGKMYIRSAGTNVGKAIPNYTLIPMYEGGFKRVDEIVVGDKLIGSNGGPTTVLAVYPQAEPKEIYEIHFEDKRIAECCSEHLWGYYEHFRDRIFETGAKREVSYRYKVTSLQFLYDSTKDVNFRKENTILYQLPVVAPVRYPEKNYPIPPYIMGAIIGAGLLRPQWADSHQFQMTCANEELVQQVADFLQSTPKLRRKSQSTYGFERLTRKPHPLVWIEEAVPQYPELFNLQRAEMFFPEEYLYGSVEQRLDLLMGFVESTVSVSAITHCPGLIGFYSSNKKLVDQLSQLAHSLGYILTTIADNRTNKRYTRPNYQLFLHIPVAQQRKLYKTTVMRDAATQMFVNKEADYQRPMLGIDKIVPTGKFTDMTCFTVDAKDALFCMNDFILTHNTRASVHDACNIAFPIRYDNRKQQWMYYPDKQPQKVLYLVTEQTPREIQLMALAWITGIEERTIKTKLMKTPAEKERLATGLRILEHYGENFLMEEINNPDLNNVNSTILSYVRGQNVKYVFYDYIFTSPALLEQFSSSRIREDVILGLISNQLKEIAKTYGVFVMTSTQLNGEGYKPGEKHDARMLRGAKSIADKADTGLILSEVSPVEKEEMKEYINAYGMPTHVIDIYKLRNGRYKNIRIWIRWNPGNGDRQDLFITDQDKNLVALDNWDIIPALPGQPITDFDELWRKEQLLNDGLAG